MADETSGDWPHPQGHDQVTKCADRTWHRNLCIAAVSSIPAQWRRDVTTAPGVRSCKSEGDNAMSEISVRKAGKIRLTTAVATYYDFPEGCGFQ